METQITPEFIQQSLAEVEKLSEAEYGREVRELLDADDPYAGSPRDVFQVGQISEDAFWRLGRLAGIVVKEPFSTGPVKIDTNDVTQTGAAHRWPLLDHETLVQTVPETPQYEFLTSFLIDEAAHFDWMGPAKSVGSTEIAYFLEQADSERGIFRSIASRLRPLICGDKTVEEVVEDARSEAKMSGMSAFDAAGQASGAAIGSALASAVPWLAGAVPGALIGILVVLLLKFGLDSFCQRTLPPDVTGQVES